MLKKLNIEDGQRVLMIGDRQVLADEERFLNKWIITDNEFWVDLEAKFECLQSKKTLKLC